MGYLSAQKIGKLIKPAVIIGNSLPPKMFSTNLSTETVEMFSLAHGAATVQAKRESRYQNHE